MSGDDSVLLSVIVYCDGAAAPLTATLESLGRQTLAEFAVILVGTPPSEKQLPGIAPGFVGPGVREVSLSPTAGPVSTATRNEAIDGSSGRLVVELAAGDRLEPTMLEKTAWALETTPRAGLVAIAEPPASRKLWGFGPAGLAGLAHGQIDKGTYMLRVAAWRAVGGFRVEAPEGAADRDLLIRLVGRGWEAPLIPETLTHLHGAAVPGEPASDEAAQRWLRSRHRRFYARAKAAELIGGVADGIGRRAPFLLWLPHWISRKLEVEGLTDRRRALRHPVESLLRLVPRPLKGRLWRRLNLPARPPMWTYEPPLLEIPGASSLRPIAPPIAKAGRPRKTRLLVVHHYLTVGGADAVLLNLLAGLDRTRFEIHLITTDFEPGGELKHPWLSKFAEQTDSIYQLRSFLPKDYCLRFLVDFIASRQVDVVLVSLSIFTYQALPQLRESSPDTAFVDLLHAEAPYAPIDHIRLAGRYREHLDRRVVITESLRSVQISRYGETADRVVVIPNGIDTAGTFNPLGRPRGAFRSEMGIGENVAVVAYIGRMASEKQPIHVARVAERLRDRSEIAFVLVGDGVETASIRKLISSRGLTNIDLSPARDDVETILADADVVMFPSKREGLPMAGLESMSMGKPIVASKVPGWAELISDGVDGFLVDDGDIAGYAGAITRLLGDPALYDRMSRAGREKATRAYDLAGSVRAWERLLSAYGDEARNAGGRRS